MDITKYLNLTVEVIIDRPLGSIHPQYGYKYPINYGYIPETMNSDGEEIDAYVIGVHEALCSFTGKVIAIIHRTNDDDDKLVVSPPLGQFTDRDIRMLTDFQEKYFDSKIIR